jgi:hypothetical protein
MQVPDSSKRDEAIKRLVDDLGKIESQVFSTPSEDIETISLIVDDALQGIDIPKRYPSFYQKLVGNAELRQLFLDTLESVQNDHDGNFVALPNPAAVHFDLRDAASSRPTLVERSDHSWQIGWQRTIEQLQRIFSPSELVYRSEPALFDGPRFILLQDEVVVGDATFEIRLECRPSLQFDDLLSVFLTTTIENSALEPQFPVRVLLVWGSYRASMTLVEQGRVQLPDIPVIDIFDQAKKSVNADLSLTIETTL